MQKSSFFSFGEQLEGFPFKVLDERQIRASAGITFLMGLYASINGFILQQYAIIPYIIGFIALNFAIGVFVNPRFMPTMVLAGLIVKSQTAMPVGAIQKRFAWSLGLTLALAILFFSIKLQSNTAFFEPTCFWCVICLLLLYSEAAFGVCVGCKLYFLSIRWKLIKEPEQKPNCMGDACEID